jgi:hypothetical protein
MSRKKLKYERPRLVDFQETTHETAWADCRTGVSQAWCQEGGFATQSWCPGGPGNKIPPCRSGFIPTSTCGGGNGATGDCGGGNIPIF